MGRFVLAVKVLFSAKLAKQVLDSLQTTTPELPAPKADVKTTPPPPQKPGPKRNDATTLLSALQREARFVDFIQEPIDGYSDAQVGAAVREIHRGCAEILKRMFAPVPIVDGEEGSTVEVADPASGLYRLTGNVAQASAGVAGQLTHHGWAAGKCEIPKWSGDDDAVNVIAAAEVQVS